MLLYGSRTENNRHYQSKPSTTRFIKVPCSDIIVSREVVSVTDGLAVGRVKTVNNFTGQFAMQWNQLFLKDLYIILRG